MIFKEFLQGSLGCYDFESTPEGLYVINTFTGYTIWLKKLPALTGKMADSSGTRYGHIVVLRQ